MKRGRGCGGSEGTCQKVGRLNQEEGRGYGEGIRQAKEGRERWLRRHLKFQEEEEGMEREGGEVNRMKGQGEE